MTEVAPSAPNPGTIARLSALAVPIGIVAALGASLFLWLVEKGQEALYSWLPESLGLHEFTWWWSAIPLTFGAILVLVALRLPGKAGGGPLGGFHFDTPFMNVPSVLLAALGSLIAGIAVGPEAPLIVVGTTLGALFLVRKGTDAVRAAMFIGGMAAISAVFGSPMITAFMMLEFMAVGFAPAMLLIPSLVGLAASYLVQIGIWSIPGVGVQSLSVPGVPGYPVIEVGDVTASALVAILSVVVAALVRLGAEQLERIPNRSFTVVLGAVVTAAVTAVAVGVFHLSPTAVLFSGNAGMAALVAETSAGVVVVVLLLKSLTVLAALGTGYRGGAIFPATYLGVATGMLIHLLMPETGLAALVATGIATSAAVFIKLPATSALLAVLLISGAGPAIAPFAILGAVIGVFGRIVSDQIVGDRQVSASSATTAS